MGLFDKVKKPSFTEEVHDESAERAHMEAQVREAWIWLRGQLDAACDNYQRTRDESQLQAVLAGRALDSVKRTLDYYMSQYCIWSFRDRRERGLDRVSLEDRIGNTLIIRIYFNDYSTLEQWAPDGSQIVSTWRAGGDERALKVRIDVTEGSQEYFITDVASLEPGG